MTLIRPITISATTKITITIRLRMILQITPLKISHDPNYEVNYQHQSTCLITLMPVLILCLQTMTNSNSAVTPTTHSQLMILWFILPLIKVTAKMNCQNKVQSMI